MPLTLKAALIGGLFALSGCGGTPEDGSGMSESVTVGGNGGSARSPVEAGWTLPEGTLNATALANFAKQKRDYQRKDEFSKAFDDGLLAGRGFRVAIDIPNDGMNSSNWARGNYYADREQFELEATPVNSTDADGPSWIPISYTEGDNSTKEMSNAFGATVDINVTENWQIGVGVDDPQSLSPYPYNKAAGHLHPSFGALTTKMPMKPDDARKLSSNLRFVLEGKVTKNSEGSTVDCHLSQTEPTIDNRSEETVHICVVIAKLSRVAFEDRQGNVIKEWKNK